ncbi:hypothetical protein D3C87_1719730 [compost metagenome]
MANTCLKSHKNIRFKTVPTIMLFRASRLLISLPNFLNAWETESDDPSIFNFSCNSWLRFAVQALFSTSSILAAYESSRFPTLSIRLEKKEILPPLNIDQRIWINPMMTGRYATDGTKTAKTTDPINIKGASLT